MKNIEKVSCFLKSTENSEFGSITTLTVKDGISAKNSINYQEKSLLTNYVYDNDGLYNLIYTIIDTVGNVESYKEDDGILPTLFLSSQLENYVSILPYHPDKELEISIPIFNREETKQPKGNRPFVGDFVGVSNAYSIFHHVDMWSETKPDKLLSIEFKNGVLKKKHNIKIPLPRNNKIFIHNNEIHLLSYTDDSWLHRQIDEKGKELRKRIIKTTLGFFREILSLSFDKDSYVIHDENGNIQIETITTNGSLTTPEIINLKDEVYNIWKPIKISEDKFVTAFNGEFGNGWFTTKKNKVLELFHSKDIHGFKELVSDKTLHMTEDNMVVSSINKTKENNYSVILYPKTDRGAKNKKIVILQRELK